MYVCLYGCLATEELWIPRIGILAGIYVVDASNVKLVTPSLEPEVALSSLCSLSSVGSGGAMPELLSSIKIPTWSLTDLLSTAKTDLGQVFKVLTILSQISLLSLSCFVRILRNDLCITGHRARLSSTSHYCVKEKPQSVLACFQWRT